MSSAGFCPSGQGMDVTAFSIVLAGVSVYQQSFLFRFGSLLFGDSLCGFATLSPETPADKCKCLYSPTAAMSRAVR